MAARLLTTTTWFIYNLTQYKMQHLNFMRHNCWWFFSFYILSPVIAGFGLGIQSDQDCATNGLQRDQRPDPFGLGRQPHGLYPGGSGQAPEQILKGPKSRRSFFDLWLQDEVDHWMDSELWPSGHFSRKESAILRQPSTFARSEFLSTQSQR